MEQTFETLPSTTEISARAARSLDNIPETERPGFWKKVAFIFCAIASVAGWAAIIGLFLLFKDSWPF